MSPSTGKEISRLTSEKQVGEEVDCACSSRVCCASMSCGMDVIEKPEKDRVFEVEGARVFVDPKSWLFLNGTTVDFKESLMVGCL